MSSTSEVFLRKGVLKICSKFIREHPCRSAISINLQSNYIEIALRHGCPPVNLLHIFRTPFPRNSSGWLLLTRITIELKLLNFWDCLSRKKSRRDIFSYKNYDATAITIFLSYCDLDLDAYTGTLNWPH